MLNNKNICESVDDDDSVLHVSLELGRCAAMICFFRLVANENLFNLYPPIFFDHIPSLELLMTSSNNIFKSRSPPSFAIVPPSLESPILQLKGEPTDDALLLSSRTPRKTLVKGSRHGECMADRRDRLQNTCTVCHNDLPARYRPHFLPANPTLSLIPRAVTTARIFCYECWSWIYDLGICWTCGEIVGRKEEKVGFEWCWWHWGCLACMLCRACGI